MQATQTLQLNETIMIQWKGCTFSEHIFAWFESNLQPVFADKMADLMLPEDYVIQQSKDHGAYEYFTWNKDALTYLYAGRLYVPDKFAHFMGFNKK
jgi:hypothetical protein